MDVVCTFLAPNDLSLAHRMVCDVTDVTSVKVFPNQDTWLSIESYRF